MTAAMAISNKQDPIVLVIDFHHARGPEIEHCIGDEGTDPAADNDWSLLPFMALSDGAHLSTEEFSYFTLRRKETPETPATSLFGIACSRQLDAKLLINRPPEVTRSTVQKAVVVVTDSPQRVGQLREKLSVVTSAWFAQRDFSDVDILRKFREGLVISLSNDASKDQNLGLSLREMIHEFKYQTLVLFKGLLLQPKMLFFGTRCERLCMIQFSLISLIPGLINSLQDCADPAFDSYTQSVEKPTSLKTSDRGSLLAYMGLPLQIFGKGSMFGPYTPLQQLDLLADDGTKSRWIDVLTQIVNETWDDAHPSRPKTLGFMGSEEFIRLQFEEYLLALLSSMKYHEELVSHSSGDSPHRSRTQLQNFNIEGDPALDFNAEFLAQWQKTSNYALFSRLTSDALLFSITEPRHPSAGGLTMDDIQRRLSQQVADLHLDERVREGREALGRQFATGQKKVSAAFNGFWSDIESMREAQRKRNEEKAAAQSQRSSIDTTLSPPATSQSSPAESSGGWLPPRQRPSIDVAQAQATVSVAGQKAGAYFSSWGSWASEKRKEWQDKRSSSPSPNPPQPSTPPVIASSPSTPKLQIVTETPESDRGRRRSMQQQRPNASEDASEGLSRSGSRRKRWSNILLRRESGEFKREEGSDGNDQPYPKSPLSQGFPAYEPESQHHDSEVLFSQNENKKPTYEAVLGEDDGFSAVPLTPSDGLRVNLNPKENTAQKTYDTNEEDYITALPVKEEK
ncbi:Late secretory pathway protein AVL9 [Penicillium verhagenii]|uniref:Late secretory pathway protein AVL9 n=1 Tax=Penicillium verhagenii TaxID=1562060 RepID=UPI002544D35C|nr:Late secretory pathway protein AVL9 [Penicillium verhagenii]KAJ5915727.1 Late secretory pathway protein AVL9 [Penicillium verhagenii]